MNINNEDSATHDLRILDNFIIEGNVLCVDLLGGPQNACGSVKFTFNSYESLMQCSTMVDLWRQENQPVSLICENGSISLAKYVKKEEEEKK